MKAFGLIWTTVRLEEELVYSSVSSAGYDVYLAKCNYCSALAMRLRHQALYILTEGPKPCYRCGNGQFHLVRPANKEDTPGKGVVKRLL